MTVLIDTHAHLDFPHFRGNLDHVLQRAREAGIVAILNAGADEASSRRSLKLSNKHSWISASAGIHPHSAAETTDGWIERLEELALNENVLAIGETGLDFYRNLSPRKEQEIVFREQLRLASRIDKPLIIHTRNAHPETIQILKEEELPTKVGVMHCFSGDLEQAEAYLELGFYISFAGPITYARSHELRDLLKHIPADRLLLETDSPYLLPQARRGEKHNEPAYIRFTYERVALELNLDCDELARKLYVNAIRLFSDRLVDRA